MKKKKLSDQRRGSKNPNFGKKMSEEQKAKIRATKAKTKALKKQP